MIEAQVSIRKRSFDGQQAAIKERNLSPWTKPLIKEIVVALPTDRNRYERQGEPGNGEERKSSPWARPLPKDKASASSDSGKRYKGYEESGREEKIRKIKDRLSSLGAEKEKARIGSEGKEKGEPHKAKNLGKEEDGRVQCELSYDQFLRLIRGEGGQDEKTFFLKEAQHPVLEAIDMAFDFIAWLIGLFLSPILEEDDEKDVKKDQKKEEDDWYRRRYEKHLRRQSQEEKEDDSGTVRIYGYSPKAHKAHETRQGFQ